MTATAPPPTRTATARHHDLDWLRVVAVLAVFVFHAAHPFDLFDWHVKNQQRSLAVTLVLGPFVPWGMGLLFLLAGASSRLALRSRTAHQYLRERWRRLAVPFLVGSALLSPIQAYVEALHKGRWSGSPLAFFPVYWRELATSVWHLDRGIGPAWFGQLGYHLWFLGFLFAFSVLGLPVFAYLEGASGQRLVERVAAWGRRRGGALLLAVPITAVHLALRAAAPDEHDWAEFAFYFVFFVAGYLVLSDPRLEAAVRRDLPLALALGVAGLAALFAADFPTWLERWSANPTYSFDYLLLQGLYAVYAWSWTVVAVGVAGRVRRFQTPVPRAAGLALPFYVLHQPVILAVAFVVVQANAGIPVKLALLLAGSFAATAALCGMVGRDRALGRLLGTRSAAGSPVVRPQGHGTPGRFQDHSDVDLGP
jgi:glucans biosynthesis protein C